MGEKEICVVLENDTGTLEDISSSLGLIQYTVVGASTVVEALTQVQQHNPRIVLARIQTNLEPLAGVLLAQELAANPDYAHIPVAALYYTKEESELSEELERFVAKFEVPVRFPDFTRYVKEYLDSMGGGVAGGSFQAAAEPVVPSKSAVKSVPPSNAPVALKRRMVIAYAIQLEVLRQLEQNAEFQSAAADSIPELVGKITAGVCANFRIGEIVG